jgi:ribosomal-protein-alanine N-acetyltransferase
MSPSSLTARIRPMVLSDLDRVLAIVHSLPAAPHWPLAAYQQALEPDCAPRRLSLVAEQPASGELFAFAVALLLPPEAELEIIAVAAEAQRRGLAGQLFRALAEDLKQKSVSQVILEVRASNLPALALYRTLGFRQTGRRLLYYADPIEDALLINLSI